MNKEVIVTLCEGHYHSGVASLLNSLVSCKYRGFFRVGYKGSLPPWVSQLTKQKENFFLLKNQITIEFVEIETEMHFGYFKPFFMKDTLEKYQDVEKIYYFDPDIVVGAPWSFVSSWIECGVALCLDNCFPFVHYNHPWRKDWANLAGGSNRNDLNYYVNTGFIGILRLNAAILEKWIEVTKRFKEGGGNVATFEKTEGANSVKTDQDLLNAVLTVSPEYPLSIIGKEGMGFTQPAYLMSHAVSNVKPWKKNFFKFLITNGKSPSPAEKAYIKYANSPIEVYSKAHFRFKQLDFKLATVFGRILG